MRWLLALALLVGIGGLAAWALANNAAPHGQATSAAIEALQAPADSGFARVTAPRAFQFPRDHGPHPEYKTEWWYYTGNLEAENGEHFGFQLTFFRQGLAPEAPGAPSKEPQVVTFGPFEFDLSLRRLARDGEQIALTTGEFSMLKALVRHPRQPLSRDKLAQLARGREFEPFDRSLDVQISRLRKMIEPDPAQPRYIQTVWGVGYVFVPDGAS